MISENSSLNEGWGASRVSPTSKNTARYGSPDIVAAMGRSLSSPIARRGAEPLEEVRPEGFDAGLERLGAAPVVQDVLGGRQLALGRSLGGDHRGCLLRTHAAPGHDPLDLLGLLRRNHHQGVHPEPVLASRFH